MAQGAAKEPIDHHLQHHLGAARGEASVDPGQLYPQVGVEAPPSLPWEAVLPAGAVLPAEAVNQKRWRKAEARVGAVAILSRHVAPPPRKCRTIVSLPLPAVVPGVAVGPHRPHGA